MYQNLFDSHSHSENSLDGTHSVMFMTECAIRSGLHGLAITDHCDCNLFVQARSEMRLRQSALDVAKAREAFKDCFILTYGVELGQPSFDLESAERLSSQLDFDVILGAVHVVPGWEDFYDIDYTDMTAAELHRLILSYWEEVIATVEWGGFDVLAHLSMPVRYPKLRKNIDVDLTRYADAIDEILRLLVAGGKGLELNTSGLRVALGQTLPPDWVIKRYHELGGELVTIGSDAHYADDVGKGVDVGMGMLAQAGYEYFAFYRARNPVMLRII